MRILDMMETAVAPYQADVTETASTAPAFPEPIHAGLWSLENLPDPEQVLADAADVGAKTVIVAPSKARKSFFLLQLSLCVAAGRPTFLSWDIPCPRNVLLIQLEITPVHFQKRLCRMMRGLGIHHDEIANRLHIINGRGSNISIARQSEIIEHARKLEAEVIVIDPIYKLIEGDENKAEDVKPLLLMFDQLATLTGAAVIYAHHTGKGVAGDRQAIDRAVGSGVLARDFDTQISLVPHQSDGLVVCEQIARSYPPKPPTTLRWENEEGCFVLSEDRPVVGTSSNRNRTGFNGIPILDDELIALFKNGPLPADVYVEQLSKQGMSVRSARAARQRLLHEGKIASFRETKFQPMTYYGTPDMIAKMRHDHMNPKLPLPPKSASASQS